MKHTSGLRLFCAAFLLSQLLGAATKPKLSAGYQDFLTGPTSLLLTRDERTSFQRLQADDERDSFIARFWKIRNPTPGLLSNEFKEEFYRRVAYADSFYGKDSGSKGWRTDRGRAYILFGKPQTSMSYNGNQELFPVEVWFYSNPGLTELPAFFYVMFFEGDGVSGFHLYQPVVDGPDKLLREGGNSKAQAYRYLRSISPELANATLSYIPGEPLDTTNFNGSMASNAIVNAVQGFNEMPSYVSRIRLRSLRMERVDSKVEYKLARTSLAPFLIREDGKNWLHWRVEVSDPTQPQWKSGKITLHVHSRLYSQGRLVLERTDDPVITVPEKSLAGLSERPLVYQDIVAVEPGRYQIAIELTNSETSITYDASSDFNVAAPGNEGSLSDILVVDKHRAEQRRRPFQFGGVEFFASSKNYVVASRGLSILYQLQLPSQRPEELSAHYAVGRVSDDFKKTFDEKLNPLAADSTGSLLIAKTLPIQELPPGSYRLSVRIEDPASKKIISNAASFTVIGEIGAEPIVISRTLDQTPQSQAASEYERALCQLSQERREQAAVHLRQSLAFSDNSTTKLLLEQLLRTAQPGDSPNQKQ